jgi:hypothetical protein
VASLRLPEPAWTTVVRTMIGGPPALVADAISGTNWPTVGRGVAFTPLGEVLYYLSSGENYPSPEESLAEAVSVFEQLAPHVTYGFVTPVNHPQLALDGLLRHYWESVTDAGALLTPGSIPWTRGLLATRGLDAFPCMLLGPRFPNPEPDSAYTIKPLPDGSRIATHRHADTWLGTRHVAANEMQAARESLRPLLLSQKEVNAEAVRLGRRRPD